jgi:endonuclease-3
MATLAKSEKCKIIRDYFNEILPNARCELNYSSDYEFLIAVMLSAQTTDKKVNSVTPILFSRYKTLVELADADVKDVEEIIKPLGLYKVKAKNVVEISKALLASFDGKVPSEKTALTTLSGVGNKTANVVEIELFKYPEFPVDTHVRRVANRLGLVDSGDVAVVEKELRRIFPRDSWILLHHQFIHFGRYYCKAQNPSCSTCKLRGICLYYAKTEKLH